MPVRVSIVPVPLSKEHRLHIVNQSFNGRLEKDKRCRLKQNLTQPVYIKGKKLQSLIICLQFYFSLSDT